MGDFTESPVNCSIGRIAPEKKLSLKERNIINENYHRAAYERGEFPYSLFPTRQSAFALAFVSAASFAALAGMIAHIGYEEAEQKRLFDEIKHDTTGWPLCNGRQAYWRDKCVEPKTP